MLTLESILRTTRQMNSFGEGRHHFGRGIAPLAETPIPRDHTPREAKPPFKEGTE